MELMIRWALVNVHQGYEMHKFPEFFGNLFTDFSMPTFNLRKLKYMGENDLVASHIETIEKPQLSLWSADESNVKFPLLLFVLNNYCFRDVYI